MLFVKLPWLFTMCLIFSYEIHASSHWMVTESGLIQPRLDSPFDMARPYDLLEFLNQEKRWDSIFELFDDLGNRQIEIDKLWADVGKYTDIGKQIAQDDHCLKAGNVNIIDWYAALLEDGSNKIHPKEFLLPNPYYGPNSDTPDCKRISSLAFSMSAFEHLPSMKQRANLTANPEFVLPELISPIMTIDQYGHWLTGVLRRNSSSWLHYHMASLYWRVRGSVPKAIECSRRALHYVPRVFKDVALGSLGVVLHRSGKTKDAIIVLNAAVEHDSKNYVSHFSIANAYTVAGDFNNSLKFYDKTLKLNPRMELAARHKYGVLCHAKLAVRIKEIRETLQRLRDELNDYNLKEAAWPKMQTEFLRTVKMEEEFDYRNTEKKCERMSLITGLDIKKFKSQMDKNSLIKYFIDGPLYSDEKLAKQTINAIDIINSLERLINHVNKNGNAPLETSFETEKPNENLNNADAKPTASFADKRIPGETKVPPQLNTEKKSIDNNPKENMSEFETGIFMYPPTMTVNRNVEDFDKEVEWPSDEYCSEVIKVRENLDAVIPVFLPFENKGIRMLSLLTEKIGVPLSEEHELPWHPPTCAQEKETLNKYKYKGLQGTPEVVDTGYLRTKLLEYVSDGNVDAALHMQDAEIGQRIYAAIQKKLAPKWILLTLSSLYWRVRKNNANALHCLNTALRWVQDEYKDLVLVSISSVYLEMGYLDEALSAADAAFRLSLYEPATNFLLAQINILQKSHNTHMFHLKQAVRVEPRHMGGLARSRLDNWACLLKHLSTIKEMDMGEGDICTHVKPMMNVVCEKDGENCQMSNIQCFSSHDRADTSKLVVLLEEKDKHEIPDLDVSFFDHFIAHRPKDKADRLAHHANYDNMVNTIESALNGCGPAGCKTLKPEDMSIKEEDCTQLHMQLGYWLHIVSFRQLMTDSNIELPFEIAMMTPSSKKYPDCRVAADPLEDFVTEKLARVSSDGWEPVLSMMHQLVEMFDPFDYVTLGAKLTKYVDTRPTSWLGLLGAGWWCGAGGRGACAVRCLSAAHAHAPPAHRRYALRALTALLHMQSKQKDAKEVAYLSFYMTPKSKIEAFLVAISHSYLGEYEQAIWMYRYAIAIDDNFVPAKASLHATMCLMFYGDDRPKAKEE